MATLTLNAGCAPHKGCGNVAISLGAVWVANDKDGTIIRIDPQTNKVVATVNLGSGASPLVFVTPGAVWAANYYTGTFSRIDPQTNTVVATISNQDGARSIVYASASLWLCSTHHLGMLTRLNATTMQAQAQIDLAHAGASLDCFDAVALDQVIWVAATDGQTFLFERVATTTNQVSAVATPPGTSYGGLAADAHGLWALNGQLGIFRLDPQSGQAVEQVAVMGGAGFALGDGSVWVASSTGAVERITPAP